MLQPKSKSFIPEKVLIEIIYAFPLLCPGNRSHLKASSNPHFDIAVTRLSNLFFNLVIRVNHNVDSYYADRFKLFKRTLELGIAWHSGKADKTTFI